MKHLEDIDIWREYTKSVKKINKNNLFVSETKIYFEKFKITKKTQNREIEFINNRKSFKDVDVGRLNKKERKRFISESTIDLHGYNRELDSTLEIFCSKCILNNVKNIIIITGKGEGIVKSSVLKWLVNHPEFVIGFFEIIDARGESGAFGIRLRSK